MKTSNPFVREGRRAGQETVECYVGRRAVGFRSRCFAGSALLIAALVLPRLAVGQSYKGYDDCAHAPETATCSSFTVDHVHDLGATFPSTTTVKVRYSPGFGPTCSGTATFSVSTDKVTWVQAGTQSYPSGHGTYTYYLTPGRSVRYVKVSVPGCYVDWSSAAVFAQRNGLYQTSQTLDLGATLNSGTPVIVRGTPGFAQGCAGTSSIYASVNGTAWTYVGGTEYTSYARPTGGWRDYKVRVVPSFSFRYIKVSHSNCYCDLASAEVAPYGYREYYAVVVGGQTDPDGVQRQKDPYYTWYWNVTSGMVNGLVDKYAYPRDHVYFLFEEDASGNVGKDTGNIHDTDSRKVDVEEVLKHLRRRTDSDDLVYVFWVSHGSSSSFALPGTDFAHSSLDALLDNVQGTQVFAFQPCRSGCVIDDLSQTGRVIMTSVSCGENNSNPFAETWRDAIFGSATKDAMGNISIAAAFEYTAARVQDGDEHPLLDDNGDDTGHRYNDTGYSRTDSSKDGFRAAALNLGHLLPNGGGAVLPGREDVPIETVGGASLFGSTAVPNPLRSETTIAFTLAEPSPVRIVVYNVAGQAMVELEHGTFEAGRHASVWNGRDDSGRPVAPGIYFYRIEAGPLHEGRKLVVIE